MQPTQNTAVIDGQPESRITLGGFPVVLTPPTPALPGVARTLREAARYLARHGWIQGCYYDMTATVFTPAACMVGALAIVCYGGPVEAPAEMFDHPGFADYEAAITWLDRHLLDRHGVISYEFNDAKDRTAVDVLIELLSAAAMWERINGGAA
jgi:hypothetical protein